MTVEELKYFWVDLSNKVQGPCSSSVMLSLEKSGRVDEDTMCIREGDDVYVTFGELRPELNSTKSPARTRPKIHQRQKTMASGRGEMTNMQQEWYYIDPESNQLCKPYSASEFMEWRNNGHMDDNIQVIRSGEQEYSKFHTRQKTANAAGSLGTAVAMSGASTQESYANPLNVATANGGKIFMAGDEVYALFDGDWHAATVVKMVARELTLHMRGMRMKLSQ